MNTDYFTKTLSQQQTIYIVKHIDADRILHAEYNLEHQTFIHTNQNHEHIYVKYCEGIFFREAFQKKTEK